MSHFDSFAEHVFLQTRVIPFAARKYLIAPMAYRVTKAVKSSRLFAANVETMGGRRSRH